LRMLFVQLRIAKILRLFVGSTCSSPMFSYRHAFHAGNHADVLKHLVLLTILRHLTQKDTALQVIDTHAGAGLYRLDTDQANTSAEAHDGILRLVRAVTSQGAPTGQRTAQSAKILCAPALTSTWMRSNRLILMVAGRSSRLAFPDSTTTA